MSPQVQRFSRIYRGRKELIDHIFVSHALVGKIAQDTSPPTPQDAPRRGPDPGGSGKRSGALCIAARKYWSSRRIDIATHADLTELLLDSDYLAPGASGGHLGVRHERRG